MADRHAEVWLLHWSPWSRPQEDVIHLMDTYPVILHMDTDIEVVRMIAEMIHAEHLYTCEADQR